MKYSNLLPDNALNKLIPCLVKGHIVIVSKKPARKIWNDKFYYFRKNVSLDPKLSYLKY